MFSPTPLHPCQHREILAGPLATVDDVATWAGELAAAPCPACAATPAPPVEVEPVEAAPLPPEIARLLLADGKASALRAQVALDALGVGPDLYPGIAAQLSRQPGTSPWWRRWWATWREGALVRAFEVQGLGRESETAAAPTPDGARADD